MKKGKFNFIDFGHALGRSEMKKLMAGSGDDPYCGNIYCDIGGSQWHCGSGCGDDVIIDCLGYCEIEATLRGTHCNGCARFQ